MAKLNRANVTKALLEQRGILGKAAESLDVTRQNLRAFLLKHPDLEEVRQEASEQLLDVAEAQITNAIEQGDLKTVRWYMERRGKDRGYSTRVETTGKDGGPIEQQVDTNAFADIAAALDGHALARTSDPAATDGVVEVSPQAPASTAG
jgi:hypothetical protein